MQLKKMNFRPQVVMKYFIILVGIIYSTFGCRKDQTFETCETCKKHINPYSSAFFLEDAEQLTYRLVSSDSNHVDFNKIELNQDAVNCTLGKLSAIYATARNTKGPIHLMLNKWNVHITQRIVLYGIAMEFTTNTGLYNELITNPGNTSNAFLNELYNEYGFKFIYKIYDENTLSMTALKNHNVRYIKQKLQDIEEISKIYISSNTADGPSIEHFPYPDHDIFIFKHSWGDCMFGCIFNHYWKVKVDQNCSVSLVEEYGSALPY